MFKKIFLAYILILCSSNLYSADAPVRMKDDPRLQEKSHCLLIVNRCHTSTGFLNRKPVLK